MRRFTREFHESNNLFNLGNNQSTKDLKKLGSITLNNDKCKSLSFFPLLSVSCIF